MSDDNMLEEDFIRILAVEDSGIANAARNVNRAIIRYKDAFGSDPVDVPTCRALRGKTEGRHVAMHIGALQRLQGVRVLEHLVDFADALNRRRVLSAALAGRSLLETAAAIVYAEENTSSLLRKERPGSLLDELHKWYAGGRFDWFGAPDVEAARERMGAYASGKEPVVSDDRKAINILTLIPRLDRRLHATMQAEGVQAHVDGGMIRVAYAMLSDLCHPATGTAILYTQPAADPGWIRIHSTTDNRSVRWFFWNIGLLIAPIAEEARKSLIVLGELANEATTTA